MTRYEYKVVPATTRGTKAKGVKAPEARFALALEAQINELAAEGWVYQRAEMLPSTERAGLTGTTTEWRHMLIFSRPVAQEDAPEPAALPAPEEAEATEPEEPQEDAKTEA